jgi:hypothetical protein
MAISSCYTGLPFANMVNIGFDENGKGGLSQ